MRINKQRSVIAGGVYVGKDDLDVGAGAEARRMWLMAYWSVASTSVGVSWGMQPL